MSSNTSSKRQQTVKQMEPISQPLRCLSVLGQTVAILTATAVRWNRSENCRVRGTASEQLACHRRHHQSVNSTERRHRGAGYHPVPRAGTGKDEVICSKGVGSYSERAQFAKCGDFGRQLEQSLLLTLGVVLLSNVAPTRSVGVDDRATAPVVVGESASKVTSALNFDSCLGIRGWILYIITVLRH